MFFLCTEENYDLKELLICSVFEALSEKSKSVAERRQRLVKIYELTSIRNTEKIRTLLVGPLV